MSEDMIKCPSCGEINIPSERCLFCGSPLSDEPLSDKKTAKHETSSLTGNEIICPNCFSLNSAESKTCSSCGMGLEALDEGEDESDADLEFDFPEMPSISEATTSYSAEIDESDAMPSLPDFDFLSPADIDISKDEIIEGEIVEVKPSIMVSLGIYGTTIWSLGLVVFVIVASLGSIIITDPNIIFRGGIGDIGTSITISPIGFIFSIGFFILFGWHTRYRWEQTSKKINFPLFSFLTLFISESITLLLLLAPLPFLSTSSELLYVFLVLSAFWSIFTLACIGFLMYVFGSSFMYKPLLTFFS